MTSHTAPARDPIPRLDASLLYTLDALLIDRNVTHAARRLGINQSALSARLTRLRRIFEDRLFVPSPDGRGMIATPRALALQPDLAQALGLLARMTRPAVEFDPATSRRNFVVALHEIPAVMLAADLVPSIAASAPSVRLVFVAPSPEAIAASMEHGTIDLCISNRALERDAWMSRSLFQDAFLTAQRKGHPRGSGEIDLDTFCAADHLLVSADGGGFFGQVDAALAAIGRERRVAMSIQNYGLAPIIVGATDYLCTLPGRFLRRFEAGLDLFAPPLNLGTAELTAYWHPRVQEDLAHRWLRERVFAAASATGR
ncbi:LysR family transcriptional regulator [Brevundimonas sp. LM2]|nr:LysR family transcriptional regulator [Brevundimonas sp. LM2]